jgi:hypothetical protein
MLISSDLYAQFERVHSDDHFFLDSHDIMQSLQGQTGLDHKLCFLSLFL